MKYYLRNLLDLILAHWLLRNLRRELERAPFVYDHPGNGLMPDMCARCKCIYTIRALEAHIADLERMLK